MLAAIAVFISTAKSLTEVIVVVALVYVVPAIAVVRILISVGVLIARVPTILTVRLTRAKTLLISVVDGLPEQIRAILIRLVVVAAARVPIIRRRVEVRIAVVVVATRVLNAQLLQAQQVLLLIPILRHTPLLL
jgi:hypothetical protein